MFSNFVAYSSLLRFKIIPLNSYSVIDYSPVDFASKLYYSPSAPVSLYQKFFYMKARLS